MEDDEARCNGVPGAAAADDDGNCAGGGGGNMQRLSHAWSVARKLSNNPKFAFNTCSRTCVSFRVFFFSSNVRVCGAKSKNRRSVSYSVSDYNPVVWEVLCDSWKIRDQKETNLSRSLQGIIQC